MKANTYLKTYLHILIQPVTYCYISVKRGMYLHHETRNIAFAETSPNLAKFHVKVLSAKKVNVYLKANSHHAIYTFTDWVTQPVKRSMCVYLEMIHTFSRKTSSDLA